MLQKKFLIFKKKALFTWIVVKDTPEVVIINLAEAESEVGLWGHSEDWLGVMLADDGVVSTVTVLSVSSPGEMEVKLRGIHILRKHIFVFI